MASSLAIDLVRLRRALEIEQKQQFPNLQGKEQRFADFVTGELDALITGLDWEKTGSLRPLTGAFKRYDHLEPAARARAVAALLAALPAFEPPPPKPRPARKPGEVADDDWRNRPVQFVKGIGPKLAQTLAKLGIHTAEDLLRHYPRSHLDYSKHARISQLQSGVEVTVHATIKRVEAYNPPGAKQLSILTVTVTDGAGTVAARWFGKKGNRSQLERQKARFPVGARILLSGVPRFDTFSKRLTFDRPQSEVLGLVDDEVSGKALDVGRIVPVYDMTEGLPAKALRKAMHTALDLYGPLMIDPLPSDMRDWLAAELAKRKVMAGENSHKPLVPLGYRAALEGIHFPKSEYERACARARLAFDELFWLQLGLAYRRAQVATRTEALRLPAAGELVTRLRHLLPFQLTGAQNRVFTEIQADLASNKPMNRLVQGDVGSGKTIVALLSLLVAVENGFQGALMAPTEILAEQHYLKIADWCEKIGLRVALLLGRQGRRERRNTLAAIEANMIHIVIGTHALIQDSVQFAKLGLVVIDEQHRFGVKQRATLRGKGQADEPPEVLVMTATPIPRTLAMTVHGDLDVSTIDELPPGRKPVTTQWARTAMEQRQTWAAVRNELAAGRQCYVVYPLIEDSESLETVKSATAEYERLANEVLPDFEVALIHGQMPSPEKDAVMERFRRNEVQVLVATTVIEVGVDVPNASVMVIENAERFGLAQLHQLRGRVGRGAAQSYCYLFSASRSETSAQRLGIMEATNDGFVIAEQDLALRGPGEFLGTRQSGLPDLKAADLVNDTHLLEIARNAAQHLIKRDALLTNSPIMLANMRRYFKASLDFLDA